jgi:SET domain-containing protein
MNHSCDPNLFFKNGDLNIYALKDIEVGESLTIDYGTLYDENMQ